MRNRQRAVFTIVADVPNELAGAWLQHVRDFDTAHAECRFRITGEIDAPFANIVGMIEGVLPRFSKIMTIVRGKDDQKERTDETA